MGNLKTEKPKKLQTFEKELPFPSSVMWFRAGNPISKPLCSLLSTCSESKGAASSHHASPNTLTLLNSQQAPS